MAHRHARPAYGTKGARRALVHVALLPWCCCVVVGVRILAKQVESAAKPCHRWKATGCVRDPAGKVRGSGAGSVRTMGPHDEEEDDAKDTAHTKRDLLRALEYRNELVHLRRSHGGDGLPSARTQLHEGAARLAQRLCSVSSQPLRASMRASMNAAWLQRSASP